MKFIQKLPLLPLLLVAILLGGAPFTPEPHLVEKFKMLMSGTLSNPVDIFDFAMHGTPVVLLIIKLLSMFGSKTAGQQ